MHTLNRIVVTLMLLFLLVPAGTYALVTVQDRRVAEEELHVVLDEAADAYRQRTGVQSLHERATEAKARHEQQLKDLEARKRDLRLQLSSLVARLRLVERTYGVSLPTADAARAVLAQRSLAYADFVKTAFRAENGLRAAADGAETSLRELLMQDAGGRAVAVRAARTADDAQRAMIAQIEGVIPLLDQIRDLKVQRTETLERYWETLLAYTRADEAQREADAELAEIKRITEEVHHQVLRMQDDLARIDARVRRQAERALLEKGLLSPEEIDHLTKTVKLRFLWPVRGILTAGFQNAEYKQAFGVPHYAQDIAVPQGTPVGSAADGVVFLVRDGGAKGYTYVLIGHRDGYATLYGHLSSVSVANGQDVSAGDVIGLSGGRPGTHGAGPMTTGAHLHFEVIKHGVNVNPLSVLPK